MAELATRAAICRLHGWTLYRFDCLVREGMPYVSSTSRRGDQWQVDPDAVDAWLREREAQAERQRRRRQVAYEAKLLAEAECERRREVRERERDEKCRRDAAALVLYCEFRNCACNQLVAGHGASSPEFAKFVKDWPSPGLSRPPDWWVPPPGLLQKARERTDAWIDGRTREWPNVRDLIPDTDYAVPWPWRRAERERPK